MIQATHRLYFEDPYQLEFTAAILSREDYKGHPALVLDKTCFYPEGGGQPADRGTLNGVQVVDVVEQDKRILHVMEKTVEGEDVEGRVDGTRRFDHMQQHAGQHILSQAFVELFDADTLSFHLGEQISTLEINLRRISDEDMIRVETKANEILFQNREIKCFSVEEERISEFPLRKVPKKTGTLRIVEVDNFDYSACGGTHPRRTGEIGIIKMIRSERIRDNLRFDFLCGWRVLHDYHWKNRELRELSSSLTVGEREVVQAVGRLQGDLKSQKKENKKLRDQLIGYEAGDIISASEGPLLQKIYTGRTVDEIRVLALSIIRRGRFIVLFSLKDAERAHLILARSEDFELDFRVIVPEVNALINGKGGGQPSLVQMSGTEPDNLEAALKKVTDWIEKQSLNYS